MTTIAALLIKRPFSVVLLLLPLFVRQDPVDKLIERLGSQDFQEREAAHNELDRLAREGVHALEAKLLDGAANERKQAQRCLEIIAGGRMLRREEVQAARVTLPKAKRTLARLIEDLSVASGFPIELEAGSAEQLEMPEEAMADARLGEVLTRVAEDCHGRWRIDGSKVIFSVPTSLSLVIYDAADLTLGMAEDPPLSMDPWPDRGEPAVVAEEGLRQMYTGEDLIHLIQGAIEPGVWEESEGRSICYQNGLLIIRQTAQVHAKIGAFLAAFRRTAVATLRLEVEAYAVEAGAPADIDQVRAHGTLVAFFDRTVVDKQRAALANVTRTWAASEGEGQDGAPLTQAETGTKMNIRAGLTVDGERVKVEVEAGFSRRLGSVRKKAGEVEVEVPEFARHVINVTETLPLGRSVVLARLGGTRMDEARPDIVMILQVTRIEER